MIRKKKVDQKTLLPLPTDERVASLCRLLYQQVRQEEIKRKYAPVKHVLTLVGIAGVVGLALISPTAVYLAKPFFDEKRRQERKEWRRYNSHFLQRTIRRLQKQKLVDVRDEGEMQTVILTKNGKRRILKYALEQLTVSKPKMWDGRWRLVLYDVDSRKKHLRDVFRETLRRLGFYKLQESAWLYPYPCEEQISFLREFYDVGNEVVYVIASRLEDDTPYRTYFGLE